MKNQIKQNALSAIESRKGTGEWLNQGVHFNHGYRLDERIKSATHNLLQQCGFSTRKENIASFEVLLANLLYHKRKRSIIISLSVNKWKKNRYFQAGEKITKMVKELHRQGYIDMKKGYYFQPQSRETRIWATDKLLKYIPECPNMVIYDPVELVILKDEKGRLKDYKDTAETGRIREVLKLANKVNSQAEIWYNDFKLNACLLAVFNRKFTLYGRLHTKGYRHYQGFSGEERQEITINGDSLVELDYSGLHPYLLYAKEGIQFNGDPYSIIDKRPEIRPFLKSILLFMLNAKDEVQAERAANYWLRNNHEEREILKEIGITRARPLIDAFKEAHPKISHYFCSGKDTGLKTMNLDAKIALDIIQHFVKQGIPILSIHDSFLVQEQYRDELLQVMRKVYKKKTGGFRIPIK